MIHTSMFQKHIHKVKFYPSAACDKYHVCGRPGRVKRKNAKKSDDEGSDAEE